MRRSFRQFAQLLPADGTLIINRSIPSLSEITDGLACRVITYGPDADCDYSFRNPVFDENARGSFSLYKGSEKLGDFSLNVPGAHNVSNACAALALGDLLGISPQVMAAGLSSFGGTDRRFQKKGEVAGVTIIDDYAHHPTEITATLTAARTMPHKTLWCVFQPHTYMLREKIEDLGTKAYYFPTFDAIENFLLENCIHGDVLITMGAGDVVKIGENLLGQ